MLLLGNDFLMRVKVDVVIPFDQHPSVKYFYISSVDNPDTPDLDLVSIVNQYDLYAKADIPITQNETVNMVLKILKSGKKKSYALLRSVICLVKKTPLVLLSNTRTCPIPLQADQMQWYLLLSLTRK